tara:strand:- start:71463 stop:71708 length:246 start_codon:yes stop_codon:yes gene_type:complete
MKADIHPNYKEVEVTCSCGNKFLTKSTYAGEAMKIEVCNECHPFYTGKSKIMDTEGRVDQFMRRYGSLNKNKEAANENKDD